MKRNLKLAALLLPLLSGCIIEERGSYHHPYWGPHFHDGR
jgi:hypothetical protein